MPAEFQNFGGSFSQGFAQGVQVIRGIRETAEITKQRRLKEEATKMQAEAMKELAESARKGILLQTKQKALEQARNANKEIDEEDFRLTVQQLKDQALDQSQLYVQVGTKLMESGNPYAMQMGEQFAGKGFEMAADIEARMMEHQKLQMAQSEADANEQERISARAERRRAEEFRRTEAGWAQDERMANAAERSANAKAREKQLKIDSARERRLFEAEKFRMGTELKAMVKAGEISAEDAQAVAEHYELPWQEQRMGQAFVNPDIEDQYNRWAQILKTTKDPQKRQEIEAEMEALIGDDDLER